jgi:hypothetical protein
LFYQQAFADAGNILGKGMTDSVRKFPESGYAFLLEHFGLAAYIAWMWFVVSTYRYLKLRENSLELQIPLLSEAMILGVFVVMHFSHYPFTFIGWIPIWYVFGLALAEASTKVSAATSPRKSWADHKQELLPDSGNA